MSSCTHTRTHMYAHTCTHIQMHTAWISRPQAHALGHPLLPGFTYAWRGLVPGLGKAAGKESGGLWASHSLLLRCSSLSLGTSSSVRVVEMLSLQLTLSIQSPTQNVGCPSWRKWRLPVCLWCSKPCPRPLTNCVTPGGVPQDAHGHPESGAEREFQFMWMGPSRPACPSPPKFLTGTPKPLWGLTEDNPVIRSRVGTREGKACLRPRSQWRGARTRASCGDRSQEHMSIPSWNWGWLGASLKVWGNPAWTPVLFAGSISKPKGTLEGRGLLGVGGPDQACSSERQVTWCAWILALAFTLHTCSRTGAPLSVAGGTGARVCVWLRVRVRLETYVWV